MRRRKFMKLGVCSAVTAGWGMSSEAALAAAGGRANKDSVAAVPVSPEPRSRILHGKRLGTIFNNDINTTIFSCSGKDITPDEYQRAVYAILDMRPGVLAQNVGMPDPVLYPSAVATPFDKYLIEASTSLAALEGTSEDAQRQVDAIRRLRDLGTDPFTLTIEACRKRGVPMIASYRMNAEDFYDKTMLMSDFERGHPEWKIPGANCADPAIPEVYEHRMNIFREVAERYDIDGIEFDFRRWYHMVSDPLKNHTVLTRMVRETRQILNEVSRRKGGKKLILVARVAPSLNTDPSPFVYPGSYYPAKPSNSSCRDLGLDVRSWIAEGLVDALCPSLANDGLPSLPKTREFAALARKTDIGIYPTLWSWPLWAHGEEPFIISERSISLQKKDEQALALYKDELCTTALRMYEDGADGISTFNWYSHLRNARLPHRPPDSGVQGAGIDAVQTYIYPLLRDPSAIRRYRDEAWAVPTEG